MIGSFTGAGLAFASNIFFQQKDRNRRNKASGNLALSIIARQYNDFLILRKGFQAERDRVAKGSQNAPPWLQARPMHFYFNEGLKFNYESLTFLFENKTGELFSLLALVEQRYYDLATLEQSFTEAAVLLQEKLAAAGVREGQAFSLGPIEEAVGHDLLGKILSFLEALEKRFKEDEDDYQKAFTQLRNVMIDEFGENGIVMLEYTKPSEKGS
jgi:hypothetical protein